MNQGLISNENQEFIKLKQIACILDETSIICDILKQLQCQITFNEIIVWS